MSVIMSTSTNENVSTGTGKSIKSGSTTERKDTGGNITKRSRRATCRLPANAGSGTPACPRANSPRPVTATASPGAYRGVRG